MPDDAFLQMMAGQSSGLYRGGGLPQSPGLFNMQTSNPMLGMMLQSVVGPMMQRNAPGLGMVPGQFLPTQNMVDQQATSRYMADQQRILSQLSQLDQRAASRIVQGGAKLFGHNISDADANRMGGDVAKMLPMLAQVLGPDLIDAAAGRSGSATVLGMSLQRAGFHAVDSRSGRIGQSADTIAALGEEIFANQFGSEAGLRKMKGLRAGAAGGLFEELSRRGIAGQSIGAESLENQVRLLASQPLLTDAQVERMGKRTGKTAGEIRADEASIRGHAGGQGPLDLDAIEQIGTLGEQLRMFDAQKVGHRLEELSGAVSAMRDIFGPDAPMSTLVAGLDALTQGGLTNMDPGKAEQMVRNTHNLAQRAGVSMEAVAGMTGHTAQMADRLGLDRSLVPGLVQGSLAFGAGLPGTIAMQTPKFGALDREKLTMMDQQLRTQAAASPMANRMGALMRMGDNGLIKEGSEAFKLYEQLKSGATNVKLPSDDNAMIQLLKSGGVDANAAGHAVLRSRYSNQEQIGKYDNITQIAREQQFNKDILRPFGAAAGQALTGGFIDQIAPGDQAAAKRSFGEAVVSSIHDLSGADRRDTGKTQAAIAKAIKEQAAARGIHLTEEQIRAATVTAESQINETARARGFNSFTGLFDSMDKNAMEQQKRIKGQVDNVSRHQSMMAGVGRAGMLERISTAIQKSAAGGVIDEQKLLMEGLGAVDIHDLADADPTLVTYSDQLAAQQTADRSTPEGKAAYDAAEEIIQGLKKGGSAAKKALRSQKQAWSGQLNIAAGSDTNTFIKQVEASKKMSAEQKDKLIKRFLALDSATETSGDAATIGAADAELKTSVVPQASASGKSSDTADATRKHGTSAKEMPNSHVSQRQSGPFKMTGTVTLKGLNEAIIELETADSGLMGVDNIVTTTASIV